MWRKSLVPILLILVVLSGCNRDPEAAKQKLLSTGNKYFDNGKYKEASIIYRRALQKDRRFGEAYYRLALSEERLGRMQQAIAAYRRAVELQPQNEDAYGRLADLYLSIYLRDPKHPEQILAELQSLTEQAEMHFPNSFAVNRVRGMVALTEKRHDQALEYFRIAHGQDPENQQVSLGFVESLYHAGEVETSLDMARDLIKRQPGFGPAHDFLYVHYVKTNEPDQALAVLKSKIENNPNEQNYRLQLARHHQLMGDRTDMLAALQDIIDNPDLFPDSYSAVGGFYVRIREFDRALDTFRLGLERQPKNSADFRNKMAEIMALQGRHEEAFRLVEEVLQEDKEDATALALRGALRLNSRDPSEIANAITDFEAALRRLPGENHFLRYNLGEAYRMKGDTERALVEYRASIQKRPDYLPPRHRVAAIHLAQGEPAKALAAAEEILQISPGNLQAEILRSNAWVEMGEVQHARNALERIVKANPSANQAVFQLASLNVSDRRFDEAEKLYWQVYKNNPPDFRGLIGVADIYVLQGRSDEALKVLEKGLQENPGHVGLQRAYAGTLQTIGRYQEAIGVFEKLLADRPNDGRLLKSLGGTYYSKGDLEPAERYLRQAGELLQFDPDIPLLLGMVAERQGALQQARIHYERTLQLNPDNAVALNNLAYILAETTTDLDRALTLIQQARSLAPEDPNIADTLGYIYIKKNLPESAVPILDEVVSRNPSIVIWRYHYAMALHQKGENVRARENLKVALENGPTPEERLMIEELLSRVGS